MHTIRALVAAAAVGTSVAGALAAPAGAAERPVARYHLEHAWPAFEADQAVTMTAIALAESHGHAQAEAKGGNVEFEWSIEEGEA
jgi:TRAP-type mannitol/chloroaromatic compound transport system substrate-binding protein